MNENNRNSAGKPIKGRSGIGKKRQISGIRYELKAVYSRDKKIFSVLDMSAESTLDDLCKMILDAFDFSYEHLYLFNLEGQGYGENVYCPLPDMGIGGTDVTLGALGLSEKQKFYFLYDFGDEWEFDIQVQRIYETREHVINGIKLVKGELEQYLSEDEYDDYDEDELNFRLNPSLTVRQIIDDLEESDLRLYASVFLGDKEHSACLVTKDVEWVRKKYVQAILQNRERMIAFIKGRAAQMFYFMVTTEADPQSGKLDIKKLWEYIEDEITLDNGEEVLMELTSSLIELYTLGICMPDVDERTQQVTGFQIPQEIRDSYGKWINTRAAAKKLNGYWRIEKQAEILVKRAGLVSLSELYEICIKKIYPQISKEAYIWLIQGRLIYFGQLELFDTDDGERYLTWLFESDEIEKIQEGRKAYGSLCYRLYDSFECENYLQNDIFYDSAAYEELTGVIWDMFQDVDLLHFIMERVLKLIQMEYDLESIIREIRSMLNSKGKRMTKKIRELIRQAASELPLATAYGYSKSELSKK
ncbi:MAG: hypothetical protein Q4F21_01520 [Lachnospiraceae bacterium]|nr:hypothetical protein [Lachnospiraceae bacterium]